MPDIKFERKKTYSFKIYPSVVLGNDFTNVVVEDILSRATAEAFEKVTTLHALVYPYLPAGTPDDPDSYDYLKIRHPSGVTSIIAVQWIQMDTVEEIRATNCYVKLENFTPSKLSLLREALTANGFSNFSIELHD